MTYRVIVTENAKRNLRSAYRWAYRNAPETSSRWFNRFNSALRTLSQYPKRRALAAENDLVDEEIREFVFGKGHHVWRALFTIAGDEVRILHIRRAAMDFATPDELLG